MTCYLCGYDIDVCIGNPNHPGFKTRDHVKPRTLGGKTVSGNIRYVHRICNLQKGGRTPTALVVSECRSAFLANRYGKSVQRKLSRSVLFEADYFCIGESK
jgi:hypothetical protein